MFSSVSAATYRRITLIALISLAVIIVTGAAVRLSDSGLGCSDWPACEEGQLVADADDVHGMIEFVNRVITGIVSLAVIFAVLGSLRRTPYRSDLVRWSWGLVAGVAAQIVLGAVVVQTELTPLSVTAHFLISMVLVWNAVVLHHKAAEPDDRSEAARVPHWPGQVLAGQLAWAIGAISVAVLVTGTIVTGTGPHGGDPDAERLPFDIPNVARIHGATVVVLALLVVVVVLRLRADDAPRRVRDRANTLVVVLLAQAAIGYLQYFTGVPELLVGAHVLGATLLWIAVVSFVLEVRPTEPIQGPAGPSATAVPAEV